MLLTASDTAMYEKMDRREKCRKVLMGSSAAALISLSLWGFAVLNGSGVYYALLSVIIAGISLREYRKLKREIMPITGCHISLEDETISVFQTKGAGKYEACTIYFHEVKKVMPGRRCGIPSFFIILQEGVVQSSIQDLDVTGRTIFCVKGEDYDKKAFICMFRTLCKMLPDETALVNMENQRRWKREKTAGYDVFLYIVPFFYLLPVILKLLY